MTQFEVKCLDNFLAETLLQKFNITARKSI